MHIHENADSVEQLMPGDFRTKRMTTKRIKIHTNKLKKVIEYTGCERETSIA